MSLSYEVIRACPCGSGESITSVLLDPGFRVGGVEGSFLCSGRGRKNLAAQGVEWSEKDSTPCPCSRLDNIWGTWDPEIQLGACASVIFRLKLQLGDRLG